jgi:hypothetical protein
MWFETLGKTQRFLHFRIRQIGLIFALMFSVSQVFFIAKLGESRVFFTAKKEYWGILRLLLNRVESC